MRVNVTFSPNVRVTESRAIRRITDLLAIYGGLGFVAILLHAFVRVG